MSGEGAPKPLRAVTASDWALSAIELGALPFDAATCTPRTQIITFTTESRILVGPMKVGVSADVKVVHTPPCMNGAECSMICQILPVDESSGARWCVEALRGNAVGVLVARDGRVLTRAGVSHPDTYGYNQRFLSLGGRQAISAGDFVLIYREPSTDKPPELVMALVLSHAQEISTRLTQSYWMNLLSNAHNGLYWFWDKSGSTLRNITHIGTPRRYHMEMNNPQASYYNGLMRVVTPPVLPNVRPAPSASIAGPAASASNMVSGNAPGPSPPPALPVASRVEAAPTAAAVPPVGGTNFTFGARPAADGGGPSAEKRAKTTGV